MRNTDPTRCWACLGPLTDENIVELSHDVRVSCCRECWAELPIVTRLTVAAELVRLRNEASVGKSTKAGWDQVREFFRAAQAGELARLSPLDFGEGMN